LFFIKPGFLKLHFSGAIKTLPTSGVWLYIANGGLQTVSDIMLRMSGLVKTGCGKYLNREALSSTRKLTSIPPCWDTLRAGTNEGYFNFQHIAFFAHVDACYKPVAALFQGNLCTYPPPYKQKLRCYCRCIAKVTSKVPPCVSKKPVCRNKPIRSSAVSGNPLLAPSYWLFSAHRVFRHAGRDVRLLFVHNSVSSLQFCLSRLANVRPYETKSPVGRE
jgi:hypothetical protein